MNDKIETTPETFAKVWGKKVLEFTKDYFWTILWIGAFAIIVFSFVAELLRKKEELAQISQQNIECIYLESSDLGSGQHYMLCDDQIVIRRVSDKAPEIDHEEVLEKALPTEPAKGAK